MGGTISKVDEDKALLLCRERRSHVRQALDGRCSLAEAHIAYIHALANTGMALGKLVDPEPSIDSSLYNFTSTSGGTQYPITSTDKSVSQFSNSCPSPSQRANTLYSFSPTASSISSERLHVNCMKSNMDFSTTVQEKPPVSVTATFTPSPNLDQPPNSNFPSTPPWDYFGLFHPIYNRFSLQDGRETATHVSDVSSSVDHITRLREEEGIPDLEEEIDKSPVNGKSDYVESSEDDDFDHPSSEPLVQIYKNRTETLDLELIDRKLVENADSRPTVQTGEETATVQKNDDGADDDMDQDAADQTPAIPNISSMSPPPPSPSTDAAVPTNESLYSEKETILENKNDPNKDFLSNIKEIEQLFRKASESGKEVPMMLEGNTVNFRPSLPEIQVHRSNALPFLSPFFVCFRQGTYNIKEPISNDMKYLTWHRSTSSISTSSHVPLHNHLRDGVNDSGSSHFSSMCMNSGSHASTLDRLYAWERKLYDEVKASGIVRKEYDSKCKRLRELDSRAKQLDFRGENSSKIDRTRAAVKDLHSRIGVAIHRIDSISKTIEKLRDSELQPQLEELIGGLTRMWKTMVECHTKQLDIISTLNSNGNPNITMQSEMNRQSALVLEYELNSLCLSFTKWISSHKVYLHSINQWLHRCCVFPERPKSVRRRNQSVFLAIFAFYEKRKHRSLNEEDDLYGLARAEFEVMDIATIRTATGNFSSENKLGEGGFGSVYKGILPSTENPIAIKRLSIHSAQGSAEFRNEVESIAKLQHRNLVRLLGCCIQGNEKLLVYEFLPNGSLDKLLFDRRRSVLDWSKRLNIIYGIARALIYLHEDSRLTVVHRDLKPSNILLDSQLNPKISDFGLARIFGNDQNEASTNRLVGTYGYMAPEFAMDGVFSVKSDIYSFGVVMLEIITGHKNGRLHFLLFDRSLPNRAWNLWKHGRAPELIDPFILETCPFDEVMRCIHLGLLCVQENPQDRPTMSTLLRHLQHQHNQLREPKEPASFSTSMTPLKGSTAFSSINQIGKTSASTVTASFSSLKSSFN